MDHSIFDGQEALVDAGLTSVMSLVMSATVAGRPDNSHLGDRL